ncbi:MAG: SDR family oxidoreductase [Gammaproteobacteria bacterium]|nr:SDR family oxidoreductase [Gammaproteobacteria bacterium]
MKSETKKAATDSARRDFIKGAGVLAAGAGLAAMSGASAFAQGTGNSAVPKVLQGKTALVTGAGRGIGRAIAVAMAEAGANIVALDIGQDISGHDVPMSTSDDLAKTVADAKAKGVEAVPVLADIRNLDAHEAAVAKALEQFSRIDIAVANAGVNNNVTFTGTSKSDFLNHWNLNTDVNVKGTANTLRAILPHMRDNQAGRVIAITSTFGRQGNDMNPAYVASKWAIVGMIKSAAIEMGAHNVTVNGIAPTGVVTGLGGPKTAEELAGFNDWMRNNYHKMPVGMLQPEDIAGSAVFLASDAAQYITGTIIDVAAGANARYTA